MLKSILLILLIIYLLGVFCNYIVYKFITHYLSAHKKMKELYNKNKILFYIFFLGSWYTIIKYYFSKDFTLNEILEDYNKNEKRGGKQYDINSRRER